MVGGAGPMDTSAAIYRERSPLYHIEKFNCPIVLFQGLEDRVRGGGLRTSGLFFWFLGFGNAMSRCQLRSI